MGVTSIRLNKKEEKVLNYLKDFYHCDTSSLLKKSLYELFEDIKDKEIIDEFEVNENTGKTNYISFEDLLKD